MNKNDAKENQEVMPAVGEADVLLAEQRQQEGEVLDRCYDLMKLWIKTHETHECVELRSPAKAGLGDSWRKFLARLRNELVDLERVRGAIFDFPKEGDRSPGSLKVLPEVFTERLNHAEVLDYAGNPNSQESRSYVVWLSPGVEMRVWMRAQSSMGPGIPVGCPGVDPLPRVEDVILLIQELYCWLRTNEPLPSE